jgi:hypothetical protein
VTVASHAQVRSGVKKLKASRGKGTQQRLESFFGAATVKRKEPSPAKGSASKKAKFAPKGKLDKGTTPCLCHGRIVHVVPVTQV